MILFDPSAAPSHAVPGWVKRVLRAGFWNRVASTRVERMAFAEPSYGEPASSDDSKTLNREGSIARTRRNKTAARSKEDRETVLVALDQQDQPSLGQGMDRYLIHIAKSLLSSSSASLYRSTSHPFFTRMIRSKDPLMRSLWSRKNSLKYRLIRFR